jgi:hypothetical protein
MKLKDRIPQEMIAIGHLNDVYRIIDEYEKEQSEKIKKIKKGIREMENFYPKDIFKWNNKEKLDFNRGRLNKFAYSIVENVKEKVLKIIDED